MPTTNPPAAHVVRRFLDDVRSGQHPGHAHHYMADPVLAHQLTGDDETTIHRTPAEYWLLLDRLGIDRQLAGTMPQPAPNNRESESGTATSPV